MKAVYKVRSITFKLIILGLTSLSMCIVVFLPFLKTDRFFPYRDTYGYKLSTYNILNGLEPIHKDKMYYFNQGSYEVLTGVDSYYILKYGSIVFLALFSLGVFILFKGRYSKKTLGKHDYIYIFLAVLYISTFNYFYVRNIMTMRENLVIYVMLIGFFVLSKWKNLIFARIGLLSTLLVFNIYLIYGHTLVNLVYLGTISLFFIVNLSRQNIKKMIAYFFMFITFSIPIILDVYKGIQVQLTNGRDLINKGYSVSYSRIKFNQREGYDFLVAILGGALLLRTTKSSSTLIYYSIVIGFFFIGSYIEKFGLKQDRYNIYIFILMGVCFINYFPKVPGIGLKLLLILVIISTSIKQNAIDYRGYYPINQNNISVLNNLIKEGKIDINQKILCGNSAYNALRYLFPEKSDNFLTIDTNLYTGFKMADSRFIYFKDDYYQYLKGGDPEIFRFIRTHKKNGMIN